MTRFQDGSAGDVDYAAIGREYATYRQPDPRIAGQIRQALGNARTVLNIGAGAGSYEPEDLDVTPVEPSETMRAQRPAHLPEAIDAVAEKLPFENQSFDAAMGTFTVHQWSDVAAGIGELKRVTRGPIVLMTADPEDLHRFWIVDYLPAVLDVEAVRYPRIGDLCALLGPGAYAETVPIPLDCTDGFTEGYYGRPEKFLDPAARGACSSWSLVDQVDVARFVQDLERDLASGAWDERYGHLRTAPTYEGSLRLVIRP